MRYGEQLARYLDCFERHRVHVVVYEAFRADPEESYRRVLEFLGVGSSFRPELREVNPPRERRSPRLHAAMKRAFAAPARALLPLGSRARVAAWIDRWNSRSATRAEVPAALRDRLRSEMRADVERLSALLDYDFAARWWSGDAAGEVHSSR
jgi:hypothetical protein